MKCTETTREKCPFEGCTVIRPDNKRPFCSKHMPVFIKKKAEERERIFTQPCYFCHERIGMRKFRAAHLKCEDQLRDEFRAMISEVKSSIKKEYGRLGHYSN
jgi:hypothetical protein